MSTQLALQKSPVSSPSDVIVLDNKVPDRVIWPIAGGKGGTGKSTLTANMGVALALLGYKVILVDGDLGGADLHLFFNQIAPPRSISNFLTKDVETLRDVVLPTPSANLKIVCGGNEMVGLANLPYMVKEKLLRHIQDLDADFILLDLGAGTSYNTLDLFSISDEGMIVCTPEPQARVDAYGFIKNTVYRKLRRRFAKNEAIRKGVIERFATGSGRKSGRIRELLELIYAADETAGVEAETMLRAFRPQAYLKPGAKQEADRRSPALYRAGQRVSLHGNEICRLRSQRHEDLGCLRAPSALADRVAEIPLCARPLQSCHERPEGRRSATSYYRRSLPENGGHGKGRSEVLVISPLSATIF